MDIFKQISELHANNISFTLATIIKIFGSVPGKTGFKMIVCENNDRYGTVGGGALELTVAEEALRRLQINESGIEEYILSSSDASDNFSKKNIIDMNCNGKTAVFYDVYKQKPAVFVFGGGHVGQSLLYFLKPLNYFVELVDNRAKIATEEFSRNADTINFKEYVELAEQFNPPENSYIVILTQGHRFDYDILATIFRRKLKVKYIGIIASRNKAGSMMKKLTEEFGPEVKKQLISTPVGLKIGGNTAEEIALTIAAEIQSIRYNKKVTVS